MPERTATLYINIMPGYKWKGSRRYSASIAAISTFLGRIRLDQRHAKEHALRYGEVRRRLARVVRHALDDGSLPQDADPDTEAEMMLAFVDGLGVHASLEPLAFPPARQLRLIELYLRGRGVDRGARL